MKDNSGKVLLAMLAGASAGVIAGLLMAPDTGEATRSGVKKWAGKLSKDLEKNLQTGLDEIKKMSADAYEKVASNVPGGAKGGNSKSDSATSGQSASTGSTASSSTGAGSTNGAGSTTGSGTTATPGNAL